MTLASRKTFVTPVSHVMLPFTTAAFVTLAYQETSSYVTPA